MNIPLVAFLALFLQLVACSIGDRLPEFQKCLLHCQQLYSCPNVQSDPTLLQLVFDSISPSPYTLEQFQQHETNAASRSLLLWDCLLDCSYKCQQLVTKTRIENGNEIVQFFGKWPFVRVFGVQEIASVVFSVGNLLASYSNWQNLNRQYIKNGAHSEAGIMYWQYMILVGISVVGWTFSTLFHTRDNAVTETLDYFGAAGIILANFNAIVVRYFELFKSEKRQRLVLFQTGLVAVFVLHCLKLHRHWDYQYNMSFGLVFGMSALILWIVHALSVSRVVAQDRHFFNNSIQLLPFETRLLSKLERIGFADSKLIPVLPVYLNIWMVMGMTFELMEFSPVWGLVDAHSMWHLFTIFPSLFWYDWNIWDVELWLVQRKIRA